MRGSWITSFRFACYRFLLPLVLAFPFALSAGNPSSATRLLEDLDPFIRRYPPEVETALAGLRKGVESYSRREYAAAVSELSDKIARSAPPVGDYVLLYRAKARLGLENYETALEDFRSLLQKHRASTLYWDAVLGECEALLQTGRAAEALARLKSGYPADGAEYLHLLARAEATAGNRAKARDHYILVYSEFPASKQSAAVEQWLRSEFKNFISDPGNYRHHLRRARNLLNAGKNSEARALLVSLSGTNAPDEANAQERSLLFAEAEINSGRVRQALPFLKKITPDKPELHAQAIFLKGVSYRKLSREDSFLEMKDLALSLYPQSPFTEKLLYSVATHFDVQYQPDPARAAYASISEQFPSGQHASRAIWKLALFSYAEKDYASALGAFWKHLRSFPNAGNASGPIFWMGRCYQMLGDYAKAGWLYDKAETLANRSYYGLRAGEAKGKLTADQGRSWQKIDFEAVKRLVEGLRLPVLNISELSEPSALSIERARLLAGAGLMELALTELRSAIRLYPKDKALSYALSRAYETRDDHFGVIVSLRRAIPDYQDRPSEDLPQHVWELLFPVKHLETVTSHASKNGLDPNLVLGIIRQESAFHKTAKSSANARGLMQVRPSTGREVALKAGIRNYSVSRLYQAETNIAIGTRYLASLLRRYDSRKELALAAYNAGDSRVTRWLREFGDTDMVEFVEQIPFSETRGYIKQVLTNEAHYQTLNPSSGSAAN